MGGHGLGPASQLPAQGLCAVARGGVRGWTGWEAGPPGARMDPPT